MNYDHPRPTEQDLATGEMDLIVGKGNKDAMLTLVERSLGYSIITKLPKGKDADGVLEAAYNELLPFIGTIRTITTDNGSEFARYEELARRLKTKIYVAHPYHSWEKGLIEYTNKLYRQYIPKKADFKDFSQEQVKQIQNLCKTKEETRIQDAGRIFLRYATLKSCILDLNLPSTQRKILQYKMERLILHLRLSLP